MPEKPTYEQLEQRIQELEAVNRKNEDFLRTIIDLLPSCVIIKNRDGKIILANKKTAAFYGPGVDDMIGRFEYEYAGLHRSNAVEIEKFLADDRNVIDSGKPMTIANEQFTLRNGEAHTFHVSKIPIHTFGYENCLLVVATDITEYLQAKEDTKRKSNERRLLLDTIDVQIWYLSDIETYGPVNRAHADFLGHHPQDIAYKPLTRFLAKDVADECRASNIKVFESRKPVYTEEWVPNAQGEPRLIKITKTPKLDANGNVEFVVCAGTDITDRRRAEQALKTNEKRLRDVVENMPVMMDAFDKQFNIVAWNRECERVTGYGADEIIGRENILETLYPDAAYLQKMIQELDVSGFDFRDRQYTLVSKSGAEKTIKWSNISGKCPVDDWHTWAIGIDVTQQLQAQRDLKQSEAKYRTYVDNSPLGIFVADDSGRYVDVNATACRMLGYTKAELLTLSIPDIDKTIPDSLAESDFSAIDQCSKLQSERKLLKKDGALLEVDLHAVRLGPDRYMAYCADLTDKKHLEAQLKQSQKMEAIGTLAGGIAHEFNNMLGIIIGNTELAADDVPASNPARDCIQEIRIAALRARDVVKKLLSVARKTPSLQKPAQIGKIVDDTLNLLKKTMVATIDIRPHILCTTETILADSTEISQVLINLCTNATHAMGEDRAVLDVRLTPVTLDASAAARYEDLKAGDYAALVVTDSGTGINPDILDRIFDPYFTTKDVDQGLGMGLAVVHGIVKKHHGAITVDSTPGKGTTVEVLFPLIDTQPRQALEKTDGLSARAEKILFVDDEIALVKMIKQMLERAGYEVVGQTDSVSALNLFKADPDRFDLIISDIIMPNMTGYRLAQEIIKLRPTIPIMLCTGHRSRMDKERARALGVKAFAVKPLVKAEMIKIVRDVLDQTNKD